MSDPQKPVVIPDTHLDLLTQLNPAVLSTIRHSDGLISSNPVGYLWDGEVVRISTLKSRLKYKNLLADPRATLCITSPKDGMHYIELRGTAELVDDPDRSQFVDQFTRMAGYPPPENLDAPGSERVTIVMHIEQVSCPRLYGGRFNKE